MLSDFNKFYAVYFLRGIFFAFTFFFILDFNLVLIKMCVPLAGVGIQSDNKNGKKCLLQIKNEIINEKLSYFSFSAECQLNWSITSDMNKWLWWTTVIWYSHPCPIFSFNYFKFSFDKCYMTENVINGLFPTVVGVYFPIKYLLVVNWN